MSIAFTFYPSQNQTFELRRFVDRSLTGTRRLDTRELAKLIDFCEAKYYNEGFNDVAQLQLIGRELYQWLDGSEGWLRQAVEDGKREIFLDLIHTSESQGLNPQTAEIALGLAHLPWELLDEGISYQFGLYRSVKVTVIIFTLKIVRCGCCLWQLLPNTLGLHHWNLSGKREIF